MSKHSDTPTPAETSSKPPSTPPESDFQSLADASDPGIVREFVDFLRYNKKWWMAPILIITLLLIGLAFLTASPAAPFIYTLF